MSSVNEKTDDDKNESQGVNNAIISCDAEPSQNTEDPNYRDIIENEENCPSDLSDNDGESFENLGDDISKDPELTNDIIKKLIYADGPFSDDHIFWVNSRNERVINLRKEIRRLKNEAGKSSKNETRYRELLEQVEEKERLFVKTYIKKIKFTENPPELGPPPDNRMYKKKDQKCPARSKLKFFINQLDGDVKFLKKSQNKYALNMERELKLKKRQCFEQFYVVKTPEEIANLKKPKHKKGKQIQFKSHIGIEKPAWIDELCNDDKQRLIYTRQTFTNDHIFWTDARGIEVNQQRDIMKKTKAHLQKVMQSGNQAQIASAKEALERQEQYFVSQYIHKVEIDHSLPLIHPMPRDLQKRIYDNDYNRSPFRIKMCPEQKEMLLKLKDLKNKVSLMGKYKNMYTPHILNQLHNLEFEYKKKFLVAKNPDKAFPEYELKLVNDKSKDSSEKNEMNPPSQGSGAQYGSHLENDQRKEKSQRSDEEEEEMTKGDEENEDEEGMNSNHTDNNWSRWINEIPPNVKEHLIYSKEPNADDHIFWVHTPDHTVTWDKQDLKKLRHDYQKVLKSEDVSQIDTLKKEIQDKEDLFVQNHFNKVEYDKTLPIIKPMEPRLRKALYYVKNSQVTYNIKSSPEQIEMLLDLKARKRVFTRMVRIKNMHAPGFVNELYHKEFEYQRRFLTMKNEAEIQSAMKKRQEMPKRLTKKQMKRMKQMAKKLEKANASFGNKNTTHFQNSYTMSKPKQPWHTEFSRKNQDPSSSFAQTNKYKESRFRTKETVIKSEQPDRIWGQQIKQEHNIHGEYSDHIRGQQIKQEHNVHGVYQPQTMQSGNNEDYHNQYYGYNRSTTDRDNCPPQPSWGRSDSNLNQPPATEQAFDSRGPSYNVRPMERCFPHELNKGSYNYNDNQSNRTWRNTPHASRETGNFRPEEKSSFTRESRNEYVSHDNSYSRFQDNRKKEIFYDQRSHQPSTSGIGFQNRGGSFNHSLNNGRNQEQYNNIGKYSHNSRDSKHRGYHPY